MDEKESLTHGPLLKVGRAKQHINDLSRSINSYLTNRPFRLVRGEYPETSDIRIFIQTKVAIPDEFSLILGDAVHNLRTSLDLLAYGIAGDKAPKPSRLQFPFGKDAQTYGTTIATRQMHVAGKKVIDALHALEPYPGGNELLHGLHALDVRDKHHLILTVGYAADLTADEFGWMAGVPWTGPGVIRFNVEDGVLARLQIVGMPRQARRRMPRVEKETDTQPTFTICFGKSEPFAGTVVVPKLGSLVREVERAIGVLADAHISS